MGSGVDVLHRWPLVGRGAELDRLVAHLGHDEARAAVVTGEAGVGKSELVAAAGRVLAEAGRPVVHLSGAAATSTVPGSSLGALLGGGDADAPPAAVSAESVRAALPSTGVGRPVLLVDDADLLDAVSARLLHQLVVGGDTVAVLTLRTGRQVPRALAPLWTDGRTDRVELGPLGEAAVAEALTVALDGPVDPEAVRELAGRTLGNPLYLRELVIGAVDDGALRPGSQGWALVDAPAVPPRLGELLAHRFAEVGDAARLVLDLLAVAEPLPLDAVEEVAGIDAAEAVEARGLIVVGDDQRAVVRLAHPLVGEALAAALPATRRRRLQRSALDALELRWPARPDDVLRAGVLRLELGVAGGADVLAQAARWAYALGEHVTAEALARAAIEAGDRFEAHLALGAGLSAQGRAEEADAALVAAVAAAADDGELARSVGRRSVHLSVRMGRAADALAAVEDALERVDDPAWRTFLEAERTKARTFLGGAEVPDVPADGSLAELNALLATAFVSVTTGRIEAARTAVARGLALAPRHRAGLPSATDLLSLVDAVAVAYGDGPVAGGRAATTGRAGAADRPDAVGAWTYLLAANALAAGHLDEALARAEQAAGELAAIDIIGLAGAPEATAGTALALLGHLDLARRRVDRVLARSGLGARAQVQAEVAAAWCTAREGSAVAAVAGLRRAADTAGAAGERVLGALALLDAVRLGGATDVVEALGEAADPLDGAVADALAAVARARRSAASGALAGAGEALLAAGLGPPGVELLVEAATRAERDGHADRAARWRLRAALAAASFDAAALVDPTPVASPVTDRELAVARAAAGGAPSRTIAEAEGVSVRTVDNQLGAVYRKLGLDGRAELVARWPELDPDAPGTTQERSDHYP